MRTKTISVFHLLSVFYLLSVMILPSLLLLSFPLKAEEDIIPRLVLQQPSFEVANEKGGPAHWGGNINNYGIDMTEARTGNACLKWTNSDPNRYVLCGQKTKLQGGDTVEFSVWVKTQDVKNGKATICMEWTGQNGQWLGGAYAQGIQGTNKEWTQVRHQTVIPGEAESVSITCYVTQGGIGTAWFDDVEIKSFIPPFISAITSDHYRHQSIGDIVKVRTGFLPLPAKYRQDKITANLELFAPDGKLIKTFSVKTYGKDYVEFDVDTTTLKSGKYKVVAKLRHPVSGKDEEGTLFITRMDRFPNRKSYIDAHRRLILDGKPFFPLGLYFGDVVEKDVNYLAKSPFNCIMPYNSISREKLDLLDKNGIKCIYSVKDNFPSLRVKEEKEGIELTRKTVTQYKDHPAIMAWYINDELPLTMLSELKARRDLMEELDPGRPTWVVLYQVNDIRSYIPTFDVVGTDPYPLSQKSDAVANAADWSKKTNDAVFRYHATWQVPQIFNWASYKKTKEQKGICRAPTFEEMRAMAWMNIAGGANGLVFYSYFDLWKMDKTMEQGGQAIVREPFDKRWSEVCKMGTEISDFIPILLATDKPLAIQAAKNSSPKIIYRLYAQGPDTWLLIVNTSIESQKAVFELPAGANLIETKLGSPASIKEGKIVIDLPGLEPRFLKIR